MDQPIYCKKNCKAFTGNVKPSAYRNKTFENKDTFFKYDRALFRCTCASCGEQKLFLRKDLESRLEEEPDALAIESADEYDIEED